MKLIAVHLDPGSGVELWQDEQCVVRLAAPVVAEFADDTTVVHAAYDELADDGGVLTGTATVRHGDGEVVVRDVWSAGDDGVSVERSVTGSGVPVRVSLESTLVDSRFDDATLFAPPALYDLNDIDGDGVEDYTDSRSLTFRDDRLTGLAVLAYLPAQHLGIALTRDDVPEFDDVPDRERGQQEFVQRTDIGSLGLVPDDADRVTAVATYPFVERTRSHALTAKGREPWGAYWPLDEGGFEVRYGFTTVAGETPVDALWALWQRRIAHLAPQRVELPESFDELHRLRIEALLPYYAERAGEEPVPAGFVTNCHPQNGEQLRNVLQYGFTGQTVLNALHVLEHAAATGDGDADAKALKTINFFVHQVRDSAIGLCPTLYDLDDGRSRAWWSGLLLPLAYADESTNLEELMGPVYAHMRHAIDALSGVEGTYLRCMAEEHEALLRAYSAEAARGREHPEWLATARRFGEFLLDVQEDDGTWRRAYDFDGKPIVEPRSWFGPTELNQKSSTATVVPLLLRLHSLDGEARWLDAARRATGFVVEHFIDGIKHNGGIHDSIYARPQLVDSESILFSMRATLGLAEVDDDPRWAAGARNAARLLATWVYLWDVPLPPGSTLAGYGFRSTGWSACDTCGAGYIHPYEVHAVPDLYSIALAADDRDLATVAVLCLHGSNETVATAEKTWGYARPGLQEEGLLVSWWLIDDPMFLGTGFGGRGKGEGNKTCLPWISAVALDAHAELLQRFGTTDLEAHWAARRA
ncbi:hypothetical protein [Geodermatophilus sp. URMC 64]